MNSDKKKNPGDFVLWKTSKENEPSYKSRWGYGRPGWHIECSVMSSTIFDNVLDIHAGGIDLAFPHHENEIAQCKGYFKEDWVKYFLHSGHLNIDGKKMSKSLKNFISISDILEEYDEKTLRIFFLMHFWHCPINFDAEQLKRALAYKNKIFNFFSNTESILKNREFKSDSASLLLGSLDKFNKEFLAEFESLRNKIEKSLSNNINTPDVLNLISNFITLINKNIDQLHSDLLNLILKFIREIFNIFGLLDQEVVINNNEKELAQILNDFRNKVRISAKNNSDKKVYYQLSDKVRDDVKNCGYQIDDDKNESLIKKIQ